jgi:hypothetical protein
LDAGTNAGFAFAGPAPDLGAFEYGIRPPPALALALAGADLVFTGNGGPAGGTNFLLAATDLALPLPQWAPVATNFFDLTGGFAFTNPVPGGVAQQFYRLRLP